MSKESIGKSDDGNCTPAESTGEDDGVVSGVMGGDEELDRREEVSEPKDDDLGTDGWEDRTEITLSVD